MVTYPKPKRQKGFFWSKKYSKKRNKIREYAYQIFLKNVQNSNWKKGPKISRKIIDKRSKIGRTINNTHVSSSSV